MSEIRTSSSFGTSATDNTITGTMRGARNQALRDEIALAEKIADKQKEDPSYRGGRDPAILAHIDCTLG